MTFYWISQLDQKLILLSVILCSIISYVLSITVHVRLPWSIDVALAAILFYGVVYVFKKKVFLLFETKPKLLYIIMTSFVGFVVANTNGYVDMNGNHYGNYFYFYIGAFTGIFLVLMVAKHLEQVRFLSFWGKNSLILALHSVALSFVKAILIFGFHFSLEEAVKSWFWCFIYTIGTLILLTPVIMFINKYMPFILGRPFTNEQDH